MKIPKIATMVGSGSEVKRFPIVAITKTFLILQMPLSSAYENESFKSKKLTYEAAFYIKNGYSAEAGNWYRMQRTFQNKLKRYVKIKLK